MATLLEMPTETLGKIILTAIIAIIILFLLSKMLGIGLG